MIYALLSVSNKDRIIPLASVLHHMYGYTLLSSGGTAAAISEADIPVTKVSDYTGSPETVSYTHLTLPTTPYV